MRLGKQVDRLTKPCNIKKKRQINWRFSGTAGLEPAALSVLAGFEIHSNFEAQTDVFVGRFSPHIDNPLFW